jgi:hypothetical protein
VMKIRDLSSAGVGWHCGKKSLTPPRILSTWDFPRAMSQKPRPRIARSPVRQQGPEFFAIVNGGALCA